MFSAKNIKLLTEPLGQANPITVQVLGICSGLVVTVKLKPSIVLAISVMVVMVVSNVVIYLTKECMTADAYATSCMVMGLDKAREFIERMPDTDAYLIYGDDDGTYQVWYSESLREYIEQP